MTLDFLGEVNIVTTDLDKDRSFPHNKQQPEGQAHFKRHGQLGNVIASSFCSFTFTRSAVNISYRFFLRV